MDFLEKESQEIIKKHISLAIKSGTGNLPNIQLEMLKELCYCYQISFSKHLGEDIIETLTEKTQKSTKSSFLSSKLESFMRSDDAKFSTYALAKVFVNHLETGKHLIELDFDAAQKLYNEAFEEAKLPKKVRPKMVEKKEEKPLKEKTFPAPDNEISIEYISSETEKTPKKTAEIDVSSDDISIEIAEKQTEETVQETSKTPILENDVKLEITEKITEESSEVPPPIPTILDSKPKPETELNKSDNSVINTDAGDIFETLKKLGKLRDLGILTEEEFASKKKELLARI